MMYRIFASLFLAYCCSISISSHAGQLFAEDWNSGSIDTSKWTVVAGAGTMQVESVGTGDSALVMAHPSTTFDWTVGIFSKAIYARGQNLRATFKVWGDPNRQGAGQHFPSAGGLFGPWFKTNSGNTYAAMEESLDYIYNNIRFSDSVTGTKWLNQGGPPMAAAFNDALALAVDKAHAVTVRVTCGDTIGGKVQWSTDGTTFTDDINTIGVSGGANNPLYIGFGPGGPFVYIDDIVVEDDHAGPATPTPTPPPTATPTPTPGPTGTPGPTPTQPPMATLPFMENWNSGSIDTNIWIASAGDQGHLEIENVGTGDFALSMAHNEFAFTWDHGIFSQQAFARGENLRVTYKVWGDPSRTGAGQNFPGAGGVYGPWLKANTGRVVDQFEASLDRYLTNLLFTQSDVGSWHFGGGGPILSEAFQNAFVAAVSKDLAVTLRVTLGNSIGAKFEWSSDNGQNWTSEVDTRGASGGANAIIYLGFQSSSPYVFVDDIVVENDSHVVGGPTPTPSPTQTVTPTETGKPNGIGQSWWLYD